MQSASRPAHTSWLSALLIFGAGGLLLYLITHQLLPRFEKWTGWEPVLGWFLLGGLGVFAPLVVAGLCLLQREKKSGNAPGIPWSLRLRLRTMCRRDWAWTLGGLVAVGVLSALLQRLLTIWLGEASLHPTFMKMEPLGPGRYWILLAWIPFWLLNILGEEFLWRGVLLPRQEAALGRWAWLANGAGWALFHVAFGWHLLVLLTPILFILPYVAQKTRNTWSAVIIHAGLNGPGFVAVALGYV